MTEGDVENVERLYSELYEAAGVGRRLGEQIAGSAGQSQARWQTLWTLSSTPLSVPQVARRLGVSRQHILRLTNELVSEGLVELRPNPDHKTSPLVALTDPGRAVLDTINTAGRASNEQVIREMSVDEIDRLRELLQKFIRVIKQADDA